MTHDAAGIWDSHTHVFGSPARYPLAPKRGYTPLVRTVDMLASDSRASGVEHAVMVHPSVYGDDLSCLLDALEASAGRNRGIAPVPPDVSEQRLAALHAAGIRGARYNLVSVGGNTLDDFMDSAVRTAAKIAPLGWHAQVFISPDHLETTERLLAATSIAFVFDHFAGFGHSTRTDDPRWQRLLRLVEGGRCWVKLSGFYRLSATGHPYVDLDVLAHALARIGPERLLWGSDWPHTFFWEHSSAAPPAYHDTLALIRRVFPEASAQRRILIENPERLYR